MNAFVSDTSDDNHICIRCKQTINGLDNYVEHRKSGHCEHMTADKFFNCLQLQYKYKYNDEEEDEEEDRHSVNSEQSYRNDSEDNSDEEHSEEDIYRPPKNFTGGKWKPGTHPQSNSGPNASISSFIESFSDSEDFEANKCKISEQSLERCDESDWNRNQSQNHSKVWDNCQQLNQTFVETNNSLESDSENELKCKLCAFVAKKSFDLLKHYLNASNHSTTEVFTSESITKNESYLMRNLSFICEICSFYTNQSNNYFWHLTTLDHIHNSDTKVTAFECKICDQSCDNVQNLMTHLENNQSIHTNSSGPLIVCKVIQIRYSSENSSNCLIKQVLDQFKCDFCLKIFKFKTHLKKHTLSEHIRRVAFPDLIKSNFIGDNPKYLCLKCDFKTDRESTHLLHSVNHEMPVLSTYKEMGRKNKSIKRSEDKYKCPLCDNLYICRELRKHINIHLNENPFECIQCDKRFSKLDYLKSHEKIHSGIKDKICNICGTGFALNKLLTNHMKIHDTNRTKTVGCDICGAMFHTKFVLLEHRKRHLPKSERQFKCEFEGCRYAFVTKSELSEHSRVHSGPEAKQLLCDRCPYKTKSIFALRKHYRQHTEEKRFECQYCDFKTYLSSNLCRHLRVHSGEKPYKCPYCSYVCNTQENIRKHILKTNKHRGLYVYPCGHCEYKTNTFGEYRKHIQEIHSDFYSNEQIDGLVSHLFKRKIN